MTTQKKKTVGTLGLTLIKKFETLRLKTYLPTEDDVPTIGYGHTRGVKWGTVITEEEAEAFLVADCTVAVNCINNEVIVPLNQNQFDALVSFIFNVGTRAFINSTLLRLLNLRQYEEAADQLLRWDKQAGKVLRGLSRRRARERELFLQKD